jgi:hypothetical protein
MGETPMAHATKITVTDDAGRREWTTLGDFIAQNADAFDERDVADLRAELAARRTYWFGGGAGPLFAIRNDEPAR